MKNKRNRAVVIAEAVMALPLVFILWVLAADFIKMYGLIVVPVGVAVYLVISLLVDKIFGRQSLQLEHALDRTLSSVAGKFGDLRKDR
jgi:hypothetical protein